MPQAGLRRLISPRRAAETDCTSRAFPAVHALHGPPQIF